MAKDFRPTHAELVDRARTWLEKNARVPVVSGPRTRVRVARCTTVITEPGTCSESPDAIGWYWGQYSILVECKAQRPDFLRDLKKRHRSNDRGMGRFRYYMAPWGLIQPEEVPGDWGLIGVRRTTTKVLKLPTLRRSYNQRAEIQLLVSELRLWDLAASGAQLLDSARSRRIQVHFPSRSQEPMTDDLPTPASDV